MLRLLQRAHRVASVVPLHHCATGSRFCTPLQDLSSARLLLFKEERRPALLDWSFADRQAVRCFAANAEPSRGDAEEPPALLPANFVVPPRPCRIVLVGWLGASKKLMAKYAHMYRASGHNTVLYVTPTMKGTIFPFWGRFQAEQFTEVLSDFTLRNPGMPTVVHIFSGAGFIFASSVLKQLYRMDDLVMRYIVLGEVSAVIFDSCPAQINEDMAARAVVAALLGQKAAGVENRRPGLVTLFRKVFSLWMKRGAVRRRINDTWRTWEIAVPPVPQLYLYSDADVLIPAKDIELFQERQRDRGVHVYRYKWHNTAHVEHYREHPEQYAGLITQFLTRSIKPVDEEDEASRQPYIDLVKKDILDEPYDPK